MKAVVYLLCCFFVLSSVRGQSLHPHPFRNKALRAESAAAVATPVIQLDTVRILALMVQFKADLDGRTSGNGTFLTSGSQNQIDPPPHDSAFVANKLRFLKNYFGRVSNGSLTVQGNVFSPVITLADSMAAYSPQRAGSAQPLGQLIVDSWTAANLANPSFPFSSYDAFIIFHAGTGRDIDVISILGYDPTPYDLPSLSVDLPALRTLLNDPVYDGVPVNGGTFRITNSLILPETETHVFVSGSQIDSLQLGTNGLFAASLGSYLGLPDLFDTRTGRSGIGQFGLMDGASIFAYNGLFPPEPSAWEKVQLGWVTPVELTASQTAAIPAVGLTSVSDTIYKVSITPTEYFLIENRSRDANVDGQRLTVVQNGTDNLLFFATDTAGFFFNDVRGIAGTVVDVEDYDWAISGDMTDPEFAGGGILIWHIDEEVIAANLSTNTVNADPLRRGVDLEEADGSQDIGQSYGFLEPGNGTEVGWPLDAWFGGNTAPVYKNAFNETSFPDSKSNAGGRSFLAFDNFSARSAQMTFRVTIGNSEFQRITGFNRIFSPAQKSNSPTVLPSTISVTSDDSVFAFQTNGLSKTPSPDGFVSAAGGRFPVAAIEGVKTYLVGAQDSSLFIWDFDTTTSGVSNSITLTTVSLASEITTAPVIVDSAGTTLILAGGSDGSVWEVLLDGSIHNRIITGAEAVLGFVVNPPLAGSWYTLTRNSIRQGGTSVPLPVTSANWKFSGGQIPGGMLLAAMERGENRILGFDAQLNARFDFRVSSDSLKEILVADVDHDGRNDVAVTAGRSIYAYNENGVLLSGFPRRLPPEEEWTGTPLVADLDGDGSTELIARSALGIVYAFNGAGNLIDGFPFQVAPAGNGAMDLFPTQNGKIGLLSMSESGALSAWEKDETDNSLQGDWRGFLGGAAHGNYNPGPLFSGGIPVSSFLPKDRVYNWPNPVYGSETYIRFFTTESAKIKIRIFDLAGESVAELAAQSTGGIDGEIPWNVSGVQSGIYFAHVEASTGSRTDELIFKIAVVK